MDKMKGKSMINPIQNHKGYQQNFGMKINPELVEKAKIPQKLIDKLAKLGDSNTVLEDAGQLKHRLEDYITISHPAIEALEYDGRFVLKTKSNNVLDLLKKLKPKNVEKAEDELLLNDYASIDTSMPVEEILLAGKRKGEEMSKNLTPGSRLFLLNKTLAEEEFDESFAEILKEIDEAFKKAFRHW